MGCITGRAEPQDEDYQTAAATITRMVLEGVVVAPRVGEIRGVLFAT
jgi:TetR/AcrR family transcriptional regulator